MANEDLKPCPFCGEPPKVTERPDNIDGTRFFACVVCYCGGYSSTAHKMAIRNTPKQAKADATAAWNTRATLAKPEAQQPLSNEQADEILLELDSMARDYDHYEYGLPLHTEEHRDGFRDVLRRIGASGEGKP